MVLASRTVVGHEDDQRVVMSADLLQVVDQAADVHVQVVDHGSVDFHLARLNLPLLDAQLLPLRARH
ncbi:hypothetical protein D3C81_1598240 [compost metagenome]